jgi:hypothetical protein
MANVQHSALTGAELHEPKGADSASIRDVYSSDGSGSGLWIQPVLMGWWDYNDLTTASTPIALTSAGTQYELTNDGAGTYSDDTYALTGISDIWNTSTDRFDFSGLSLGDTVDFRIDTEFVTTTTNTAISVDIELGVGGTPYQLPIFSDQDKKSAGTYQMTGMFSIYMGDANTLNNPARLLAKADKTGTTVKVNGWFVRVITRGEA